ncbi:Carbohydrate esterase 4 protein [Podila epigama]|nr:Carbohydrate esterase 4 protein [Podila epigama]
MALWPLSILILFFSTISIFNTQHQATAAPIPPLLARQPPNTFNNTFFPYNVTGPTPPPIHLAGSVHDACSSKDTYAIAFDDSPGQLTDELLDFLDEQNLKVTFFVNGDNWNCIYNTESKRLLRRAYVAQHQIAAHPWSQMDLESLSDEAIRQEMFKIEQAFRQILGVVPRYMRPPFGEHSPRVQKVLQELGYVLVLWDVDRSSSQHSSRILQQQQQGQEKQQTSTVESSSSTLSDQTPMGGNSGGHDHDQTLSDQSAFSSNRAEAVRGVPPLTPLNREAMSLSGIFQEATGIWALEYVESVGYKIQTVGTCLGEDDPRLWYKEIGPPAPEATIPTTCS